MIEKCPGVDLASHLITVAIISVPLVELVEVALSLVDSLSSLSNLESQG